MSESNLNYVVLSDKIFTGSSILPASLLKISEGVIQEIIQLDQVAKLSDEEVEKIKSQYPDDDVLYFPDTFIIPGLIDLNIRGINECESCLSKAAYSGGVVLGLVEITSYLKFESMNMRPLPVICHHEELLTDANPIKIYLSQPDCYTPNTEDFSEIISEANDLGKTVIVDCSVNDPRLLAMASPFRTEPQTRRLHGKVASLQVFASAIDMKARDTDSESEEFPCEPQDSNPLVEAELRTYKNSGLTTFIEKPSVKSRPKALVIPTLKAETSYDSYLHNIPKSWEVKGIKAVTETAHEGSLIHFCNISCTESLNFLRENTSGLAGISWETSPNYLLFNEGHILKHDTLLKTYPPIRDKRNQESMLRLFLEGKIHCIASHHTFVKPEFKIKEFARAVPGIISLGYALSAAWTACLEKNEKNVMLLVQTLAVNPGKVAGIDVEICVGARANFVIWDPWRKRKSFVYEDSPYRRFELLGEVRRVFHDGKIVYKFDD
jgi:dihydroorotase-like cyclic amidohydrolase